MTETEGKNKQTKIFWISFTFVFLTFFSETQTKLSHIEFRYKPSSSYTTMKEGKTVVKLEVQSGEKNTLLGALKVAFENYDESKPYFFFTLRAKDNVQDLVTAVDKFLTNVMLLLEILSKDSYDKHMTKIDYRVTQINSKVTVILDLGHDFTKDFVEQLDYFFKLFAKIKPNLIIKLKSYVDFLDILPKNLAELNHLELDENNEVIQPETEQGNTRFQDPNLFDFILKGFTFTSKLTCSSHVKTFIKSIAVDLIKDFGHPLIGMGLAESPEALVAKLLPEVEEEIYKTFEFENLKAKINDLLKGSEIHFPDGVDFIDEIGEIFNIMGEPLDRAPFAQEFMDDLSDLALLDADCGIIHRSSRVSFGFKSRGMKEMYEKVMEGVTEVEFEGW